MLRARQDRCPRPQTPDYRFLPGSFVNRGAGASDILCTPLCNLHRRCVCHRAIPWQPYPDGTALTVEIGRAFTELDTDVELLVAPLDSDPDRGARIFANEYGCQA